MVHFEEEYLSLITSVYSFGSVRPSRAGTTRGLFGQLLSFSIKDNTFPLLTTRKMYPKPILGELAAFLRGASKLKDFHKFGCYYWDENAKAWPINKGLALGDMHIGQIYGHKWRDFYGVDQLQELVKGLRTDPYGRRHIISCWDPSAIADGLVCLPPCHIMAQFYVGTAGDLDCMVTMRSVDMCLGLPADVILYTVLTHLVAKTVGLKPRSLTFMLGDCHIYENHAQDLLVQLKRDVLPPPTMVLDRSATLDNFVPDHITIENYDYHEPIKYQLNA